MDILDRPELLQVEFLEKDELAKRVQIWHRSAVADMKTTEVGIARGPRNTLRSNHWTASAISDFTERDATAVEDRDLGEQQCVCTDGATTTLGI